MDPLSETDLAAIRWRVQHAEEYGILPGWLRDDAPRLLAEVDRLREQQVDESKRLALVVHQAGGRVTITDETYRTLPPDYALYFIGPRQDMDDPPLTLVLEARYALAPNTETR